MSTIRERSLRCELALKRSYDDDLVTDLIDFLTDAMHWCRCNGTDFEQVFDIAERHYQSEIIEQTGVYP
jgi:hypothetical protein